jgi:hypothetical protein
VDDAGAILLFVFVREDPVFFARADLTLVA